jgi:hypothetical protein
MNSEIEDMVVAIADHQMDYDDVVEWLKERLEKV